MLNNFIYAKKKSLFETALNNGEVLDEAIVFIEDTKEIWNHGTYFDCSTTDFAEILKDYVKTSTLSSYAKLSDLNWYITQTTADGKYVDKSSNQTITGSKTFTNHIVLNNQSRIRSNIDPGELKVTRTNDDKGFIIRVNKDSTDDVLPLEILSTDGLYKSYQYNFPKKSGTVALGVKKNGQVINANLTDGLIDLGDGYIKTTYANLKNLRNNSQLIPGQKYRITDYKTTVPSLPGISVANHQFDIIVDALTTNTLSETAHVTNSVHSIGEKIQDLFSWDMNPGNWQSTTVPEIQSLTDLSIYVLLGTRTINQAGIVKVRFTAVQEDPETNDICIGADLVKNGTVVSKDYHIGRINYHPWQEENNIYYLPVTETGEYVIRYYVVGAASGFETNLKVTVEVYDGIDYFANSNLNSWKIKYCLDSDTKRFQWANIDPEVNKGVIYYMKDDKGNECPYDFKNILFDNFYTFSYTVGGILYDGTVKYQCYNNRILPTHNQDGVIKLNKNVFKNTSAASLCCFNIFGLDCEGNTFGDSCASNTFGNYCKENSFGNNCLYNSFADFCQNNRFYHYCQSNSFGTYCTNNSFGSYILRVTFGKQCINCKFSNSSAGNNQLLEACRMIKFGDLCNGVNLYNTESPSYESGKWLLNIEMDNGMSGNIQVQGLNKTYTRVIGKDSSGLIAEKCLIDSISYNSLKDKPTIPAAVTESTVSGWGFTKNSGTYSKPSGGIPKSDLNSTVQTALTNAGTAYGWGNHANAGYAKKSEVPSMSDYLPLSGGTLTGSLTAPAFYETSDLTKKNIIDNVRLSLYNIANAPSVKFTWKNVESNPQIGTIALYWKEVLPEVVRGEEGTYSVDYGVLATVSSISLAKTIVEQNEKINKLENELKELKELIKALI